MLVNSVEFHYLEKFLSPDTYRVFVEVNKVKDSQGSSVFSVNAIAAKLSLSREIIQEHLAFLAVSKIIIGLGPVEEEKCRQS